MRLRKFQKQFLTGALRPGVRTAALSLSRGNGKSTLIAHLARRTLTPGDALFRPGTESFIFSASMGQARRTVFAILTSMLPLGPYRVAQAANNTCSAKHLETGTTITVLAANPKTAQGLVNCPWIFADEPGAWETLAGEALHDAIQTAQGKPGPPMKVFYCGTLAPAQSGWWHDLIHQGTHGSTYVQDLQGRKDRWDRIGEIARCNPLMWSYKQSREVLREELGKAKRDSRLKARFLSFRLNLPTQDTATVLLAVEDFERMVQRAVPPRQGRPVVGIDLGGGRAWSAGVGVWPNGRVEAMASAPGIPSIRDQEIRDAVPSGTYSRLVDKGVLHVCQGKRVQPVEEIVAQVKAWNPQFMVADRFRQHELRDASPGCPVQARISRWSESSEDIRGLRALALDGPLAIAPHSRALIQYSLSVSQVENDDSGNARLTKRGPNNCARDDVSSALVLAAGALSRAAKTPRSVSFSVARGSR